MAKYIDAEKLRVEIERRIYNDYNTGEHEIDDIAQGALTSLIPFIDSLQQEQPDKETILRICKLHKIWSIMVPWENVEDFVITNWNSKI